MLGFEFAVPPLNGYALLPNRAVVFSADVNQFSSAAFAPLSHTPAYSVSRSLAPQGSHLSNLTSPQGPCKGR